MQKNSIKKVADFLKEVENKIVEVLNGYSLNHLLSLDVEKEIEKKIRYFNLKVPNLLIDNITIPNIIQEQIEGWKLPQGGMPLYPDAKYPVDVASCKIPFEGNKDFFKCTPSNIGYESIEFHLEPEKDFITLKLQNGTKGFKDDKTKEEAKKEFERQIKLIENGLSQLQTDFDNYKPILENNIRTHLEKLMQKANDKRSDGDKMHPFK